MATNNQLNYGWLGDLSNALHDGTTQQIDDLVQAFVNDNQVLTQRRTALHQARQSEDEVWLKSQRDAVVPLLEAADKRQDGYISAVRYILTGHANLPESETTQAEAKACLQVFKDFNFSTHDTYAAEADKIIQMQQNLQAHQAFMTQLGAWTFLTQAVTAAYEVRQYLSQRAQTKGEFVKGEMKAARKATDQAIADLYKTIEAMMDLMPSAELTALRTQLKGIELYARQYYLSTGSTASGSGSTGGSSTSGGDNSGGGTDSNGGGTDDSGTDNTGGGTDNTGGGSDNTGGGSDGGGGDDGGETFEN